jgi:hypothetical protein
MINRVRVLSGAVALLAALASAPAFADDYTVEGDDVISAVGMGQTSDGKSLDMLLLEMEGNTIHLKSAFVFTTQTEGTSFYVGVGDNVPRLICVQKSKEKRLAAMQTVKNVGSYNIVGNFDVYTSGVIYLTECDFEYIP